MKIFKKLLIWFDSTSFEDWLIGTSAAIGIFLFLIFLAGIIV